MKTQFYFFLFLLIVINPFIEAKSAKSITINKITVAPQIDGVLDDGIWSQTTNKLEETKGINENGFSAEFKICYDYDNLYVAVIVWDPTPNIIGPTSWQSDCVDLFISLDTTDRPRTYINGERNSFHLRKIAAKSIEEGGLEGPVNLNSNVVKVAQVDGIPYVVEWAIPFKNLMDGYEWDGLSFVFEVMATQANDSVTGRENQIFWNSNADDQYKLLANQGFVYTAHTTCKKSYQITDTIRNHFCTFNQEMQPEAGIELFPNPASQFFMVQTDCIINKMDIYNINNVLLATTKPCNKDFRFDIQKFSAGYYLLKLTTEKGIITKKIIIQK